MTCIWFGRSPLGIDIPYGTCHGSAYKSGHMSFVVCLGMILACREDAAYRIYGYRISGSDPGYMLMGCGPMYGATTTLAAEGSHSTSDPALARGVVKGCLGGPKGLAPNPLHTG